MFGCEVLVLKVTFCGPRLALDIDAWQKKPDLGRSGEAVGENCRSVSIALIEQLVTQFHQAVAEADTFNYDLENQLDHL
ncbi:hypothetical protein WL26_23895 [Burkholderia cepacia]|nr:hypothetical protein WL26_23895 [Burkholderia cepacia]